MAKKYILSPEQDKAASPSENVWVQANAGTGKTSVLVQRLLRILFRENSDTGILCLTYTNAAAGEMRNRILSMLRNWAMADDTELRDMLGGVAFSARPTDEDLAHARAIFFKYIDNPDILKIKTIHGFCEEILHRFPIEAGLSPAWSLVSDANQKVLLQDAFDKMILFAGSDPRTSDAFAHIVNRVSEYYMPDLLKELTEQYKTFFQVENLDKYRTYFIDTIDKFLLLDQAADCDVSTQMLEKIIENAVADQNSRKTPVKYLTELINKTRQYIDTSINFDEYKYVYLKQDLEPKKDLAKLDYAKEELARVYARAQNEINRQIKDDTIAMFDLAAAFSQSYKGLKQSRNVLDFDDLILYTRRLFSKPDTMGWVLSQLDLSLNHILVDEAQDTSPQQWDILRMMAGDFFADGDTAYNRHSLFVVGDSKQSIYGFQGADPNAFATSRQEIEKQISNNMRTISEIPLTQSFRSTAPILETVDAFFSHTDIVELTGFANNTHKCFRGDARGLVELHPVVSKKEDDAGPAEYISAVADKIEQMIAANECSAGDIMVLVQKRKPLAPLLVTELKRRGIDVAGSDRIVLPDFPAVRDMLNLTRFCLNPGDDYSLCCVLKSPIFRLTELDILNLCSARTAAIKALTDTTKTVSVFDILQTMQPAIFERLHSAIEWATKYGPYTFFSEVLNSHNTRREMIAALGSQIIDPLEEFLTICLAYERTQPGTMRHFLKWFITGGSEIKRDMDENSGVRIVTVHGSKGLEAPVVFLIDTTTMPDGEKFIPVDGTGADMPAPWIWAPRTVASAQREKAATSAMRDKIAEYYRLLYVAMTRARDRLYIFGYTPNKTPNADSWHARLWSVFGNEANQPTRITNANQSI
ncbi:MAG: UvrD-helicase domain-containing protein [Alphaproteobacteria bacterium]|nr:UvrD-helicase domain-containing protein [Alphaproteobacteria bacterium]